MQIWNGLLPNCIVKEWELYCNTEICIAVRNLGGAKKKKKKIVLQGSGCIARGGGWLGKQLYCNIGWLGAGLCHNTVHCIVAEARQRLYCNTDTVPTTQPSWALVRALGAGRAGAGRGCRRGRASVGRLGVRAGHAGRAQGSRACVGRVGVAGVARRARGARRRAAWHGRAGARARSRASGRAGVGGSDARGRAGRPAGRPVRVWCAQLGQVGCFGAPDSVFGLV